MNTIVVGVRLPADVVAKLDALRKERGMTRTEYLRKLISADIADNRKDA